VRADNKGVHAPTAILDLSGDPCISRPGDLYRNARTIVVQAVANHHDGVALTSESGKQVSCTRYEVDVPAHLSLILPVLNDDPVPLHDHAGLPGRRRWSKGQDVPNHRCTHLKSLPQASACAFRVSDPAPKTDGNFYHRNAVGESHEEHVRREMVSTDVEIRQDPLQRLAAYGPKRATNVR